MERNAFVSLGLLLPLLLVAGGARAEDDGLPTPARPATRTFDDVGVGENSKPYVGKIREVTLDGTRLFVLETNGSPQRTYMLDDVTRDKGALIIPALEACARSGATYAFLGAPEMAIGYFGKSGKLIEPPSKTWIAPDHPAGFHEVGPGDRVSFPHAHEFPAPPKPAAPIVIPGAAGAKTTTLFLDPKFEDSRPFTGTIHQVGRGEFELHPDGEPARTVHLSLIARDDDVRYDGGGAATLRETLAGFAASGQRVAFFGKVDGYGSLHPDWAGAFDKVGATDAVRIVRNLPADDGRLRVPAKTQVIEDHGQAADSQPFTGAVVRAGASFELKTDATADAPAKTIRISATDRGGLDVTRSLGDQTFSGNRVALLGVLDAKGELHVDWAGTFHPIGPHDAVQYPNVTVVPQAPEPSKPSPGLVGALGRHAR
jgi:hypothetical protein